MENNSTLNMILNLKKNFIQDFFEFLPQDKNWVLIAHKIRIKIQTDIFSGRFLRAFLWMIRNHTLREIFPSPMHLQSWYKRKSLDLLRKIFLYVG